MADRIGLFGGSFNPIHVGHLIIARAIRETMGLAKVILVPSRRPPHKNGAELLAAEHRAEMVRLAMAGEPGFEMSDFDIRREGPCYTIETVAHFRGLFGSKAALYWIIGEDSLVELPTWHRASELVDACQIVTAVRGGRRELDWSTLQAAFTPAQVQKLRDGLQNTPRIDISSSDIRRRLGQGLSVRHLVPDPVYNYIEENRIYRPM